MPKILLVEDDNNLREIYEARLQAEGYTIVSARDGEEALVVAKAEKPDLVISDVMMPKISGFEMLDILRNTDGLKDLKVIMLTALGQSEDQKRADKLGADRYLVKSQVTLEDIVKATQELLGENPVSMPTGATDTPTPVAATAAPAPATPTIKPDAVKPAPEEKPAIKPAANATVSAHDQLMADAVDTLVANTEKKEAEDAPAGEAHTVKEEPAAPPEKPSEELEEDDAPSKHKKVIKPIEGEPKKDIQTLLAEEEAKEIAPSTPTETVIKKEQAAQQSDTAASPVAAEEASVEAKIEDFVAGATTEPTTPAKPPVATEPPAVPAPTEKKITITTNDDKPAMPAAPTDNPKSPPDPNSIAL